MRNRQFILLLALSACAEQPMGPTGPTGPNPDSPRVVDGLAVLYTFDEGNGLEVHDVSGVEPAFDLELDNLVTNQWLPGGGIQITESSVIASTEVAEKVFVGCVQANAVTVEAWIEPENVTQSGLVFTYSKQGSRNVTLSQQTARYQGSVLASSTDPLVMGGTVQNIQTATNLAAVAAQHVVYTRDQTGSNIYVDGVDAKPPTSTTPPPQAPPVTDQNDWHPTYQLVLGNETTGNQPWLGKIYLAAIYCRKLSAQEVAKNFSAGH